jgi:hypothetical protein
MVDDLSLDFYQIQEGQKISLKVPHYGEHHNNDAARTAPKNK